MNSSFARVLSVVLAAAFLAASSAPSARAVERFVNGDLEAGATGFTSDYSYNGLDNTAPGSFAVTSSPNNVHGSWASYGDHTTGSGLMLTANGSTVTGLAIWRQTVAVLPGADYAFSAWGASSFSSNPASLSFRANDVEFLTLQLPAAVGVWTHAMATLNAGASSSIEFEVVDLELNGFGNDLTLDDLSLIGPVPEPATAALAATCFAALLTAARREKNSLRVEFPWHGSASAVNQHRS